MKRQQNHLVQDYNGHKKRKFQDENKSLLENLPNEILYEILEYIDIYHICEGFFNLNKRFENFLINSNLPIQMNISTMTKTKFTHYHQNIIIPNRHRINILRLSNPFTADIVFSPPRIILKFVRLETLILDNIDVKYLKNILDHLIHLSKLRSLTIHLINPIKDSTSFLRQIFRLPKLKYFKLKFEITYDLKSPSTSINEFSPIEHLVLKNYVPFESLHNLLSYLPRLRYLSIESVHNTLKKDAEFSFLHLKSLKYVSLQLNIIDFNDLQQIVRHFFRYIEVLRVKTYYHPEFLDAKQWEELILSSMPNLRTLDINHIGPGENTLLTYHDLINQFNSSFWIEKQWFFTHQHHFQTKFDAAIFYSTNPYRRKDYPFCWQINDPMCSHIPEKNLNTVKHVRIGGTKTTATNNYVNYFPNTTKLTIDQYVKTSDDSIGIILTQIIPLEQLTKLNINLLQFPLEELIELLRFTPNLHTVKYYYLLFSGVKSRLIQTTENFQYVSTRNKIKRLELPGEWCTLEQFQLIMNLFPQLEYIRIGMNKKDIEEIIRLVFLSTDNKLRHLFLLCISQIPKRYLRELDILIKSENLLDDYSIKLKNRDLYLWW